MVIHTSQIMDALISSGLTYSPEAGDPYPMRQKPCAEVARVVAQFLIDHGVVVYNDVTENTHEKA
jgi:hypothetical protein